MSRFYEFLQNLGGDAPGPLHGATGSARREPHSTEVRDVVAALATDPVALRIAPASAPAPAPVQRRPGHQYPAVHLPQTAKISAFSDPTGPAADRYRFLRLRLRALWNEGKVKSILVTSALPRDGKTTVALNLATTMAGKGTQSVLVIDADLHRAAATSVIGLDGRSGLSQCLEQDLDPFSLLVTINPLGWHFLPSGKIPASPTQLLQTDRLPHVLEKLKARFDWIICDSPPVLPLTDACILSHHTDGSMLVVRAGQTPTEAASEALEILGKKNVLGVVLNGAETSGKSYRRYGQYYRLSAESLPGPPVDESGK
jgi:capsular exopolysaccharide synthesis family protein